MTVLSRMTSPQTQHISILLVDDHPIVRQGYRRVLDHQSDFRVVAEADSAAGAYSAFKTHAPDVVVMDISMKGASGLEAIRNIRARDGRARILVFSMHSEAALVKAAFDAGASGYVTKSTEPAALIRAIRAVAHGERAMSDDIAHSLAAESLSPSQSTLDRLGEREIEILRQLATGSTTDEGGRSQAEDAANRTGETRSQRGWLYRETGCVARAQRHSRGG